MTREAAFVEAIRAAGVTFTISRNCSRGQLATCSCSRRQPHAWHWRGCSDDVDFASQVTRQVLAAPRAARDARALLTLHNNQAGRTVRPPNLPTLFPFTCVAVKLVTHSLSVSMRCLAWPTRPSAVS